MTALAAVLALAVPGHAAAQAPAGAAAVSPALQGNGMWIWILGSTNHGSVPSIVAQARRHNIRTLFIKSGDSRNYWSQFNRGLVSALHRAGLRACAWQYVYGAYPAVEAAVGARAVRSGADCLVIDAESEYEGRYGAAYTYITRLRQLIGPSYPVGLAGFPYVHFHPAFPYSVFLGPGGAQYNQPQMYWHAIGTSVDQNFSTTYTQNRIYKRPILPLGQTYGGAPVSEIRRFRQLAQAYHAPGVSWWSWQETSAAAFQALGQPVASLTGYQPRMSYPPLGPGSRGDRVVWAQQLLWSGGQRQPITGSYGPTTAARVRAFQASRGLSQTGSIDTATWSRLLALTPVKVRWVNGRGTAVAATTAGPGDAVTARAPASARLPALRREIPPKR
ncbi:MAG TPA: peptidoglycan-binding domain-containing protein [Solirubrobacteraceae bacterium]|nr:peptidoglycan-binding domain-containing protein [Solirubrobacteraceae bacterium]